jgi:4,5-DOPA dioxygenase extradiol
MKRPEFLKSIIKGLLTMSTLNDLHAFSSTLDTQGKLMPLVFVGHGSPMNGIDENDFSRQWSIVGKTLPYPTAIICISAHWYTRGTFITAMERPQTIHDFYGFPQELYSVKYGAPGNPSLAAETSTLITKTHVGLDHEWGLDHGCWSVLRKMYPEANIPILQLSIDGTKSPEWHYELAKELSVLRKKGILIIGSGNIVHNLGILDWKMMEGGFDWAEEADHTIKKLVNSGDHKKLMNYKALGRSAHLAIPSPDHYLPLMYILGLQNRNEHVSFFNEKLVMGSVSMTSVIIQ